MSLKIYAGIGARETPPDILLLMQQLAEKLYSDGYSLRSGGAKGADTAFYNGSHDKHEIFLANQATKESKYLASEFHNNWTNLTDYAQNLHGRNALIILGKDLKTPVDFVVCYTKNGLDIGGTGLAMRIAQSNGIKIINLFYPEWQERIKTYITK